MNQTGFVPGTPKTIPESIRPHSLVETCKLNAVDPQAYLTSTLTTIVNGHKQSQIDDLLPWNYPDKV